MSDARNVATKVLDQHIHLIFRDDKTATVAAWAKKINDCVGRVRLKEGKQINKGGRPPTTKKKIVLAPSNKKSTSEDKDDDLSAYSEHVRKMAELYEKSSNGEALETLWEMTLQIRRKIFTTAGRLRADMPVKEMILKHCPVLCQLKYLFKELDSILGDRTCQTFRRKWLELVPQLVKIGNEKKKKKHKASGDVFKLVPPEDEESLAMALLPILIGSNDLKAKNHAKYLVHIVKDSEHIADAMEEIVRPCPYIAMCGRTCHVIVNREKLYQIEDSPGETLLALMATYYVFDLQYESIVKPTLWFLQSFLLCKADDQTDNCYRVRSLISQLLVEQHCEKEDAGSL